MLFIMALLACSNPEPVAAPKPTVEKKVKEEPAKPALPDLSVEKLKKEASVPALVPSPIETQRALEASGIGTKLNTLIEKRDMQVDKADLDFAAVRTGVVLSDLLLTIKTADKKELLVRVNAIKIGMNQLNGGSDIDLTLKDVVERIEADAVTRDELLKEFDELSGAIIPELKFNGQERIVPLIEAGSWLEGAHLVAKALKGAEKKNAAESLLKAPAVVDYFLKYVKNEGSKKAPEVVTEKLEQSLNKLKEMSMKTEPMNDADIEMVIQVTGDVLSLL